MLSGAIQAAIADTLNRHWHAGLAGWRWLFVITVHWGLLGTANTPSSQWRGSHATAARSRRG